MDLKNSLMSTTQNNDYLLDMNQMPTTPLYKIQHQEK